jgi:hypothetical protein
MAKAVPTITTSVAAQSPAYLDAASLYQILAKYGEDQARIITDIVTDAGLFRAPVEVARCRRIEAAREAIKRRGGLWFGDYLKEHIARGTTLSEFTDAELVAITQAARAKPSRRSVVAAVQ